MSHAYNDAIENGSMKRHKLLNIIRQTIIDELFAMYVYEGREHHNITTLSAANETCLFHVKVSSSEVYKEVGRKVVFNSKYLRSF